jgi:hypothetical protein
MIILWFDERIPSVLSLSLVEDSTWAKFSQVENKIKLRDLKFEFFLLSVHNYFHITIIVVWLFSLFNNKL